LPTGSFRDLGLVCKALGLESFPGKKGTRWKGIGLNGQMVDICIHQHAGGRDVPDGTFTKYIKDLGFKNAKAFYDYLNSL
jgi:hypothetical protein